MPDRRSADRWRLNKEISIVDIITIFTAFAAAVAVYISIDKRLLVVETTFSSVSTVDSRLAQERALTRQSINESRAELKAELASIGAKIDQLNMILMRDYLEHRGKAKQ